MIASIRKRVAQDPDVLRLAHDPTGWGLRFAAAGLVWSSYGLSPKDFTEQEEQEALKTLLEEEEIQKVISVPVEYR